MAAAPGTSAQFNRRREFLRLFENDLEFFRLVFLLINKSCPIKKIDLVWAEDGPAGCFGLPALMGTEEALASSCARKLGEPPGRPDPQFCDLVNDYGRRQEVSCGISDKIAEGHVRQTRRTRVYTCHAGLLDIAVPVFVGDEHIATLLTGQVLRRPPSALGFAQIRRRLAHLEYIDWAALEKAYFKVPVVTDAQIRRTVKILQLFAQYLATSWRRVQELLEDRERQAREEVLLRREFAHLLLQGAANSEDLRSLMKQLGFRRRPNCAFVIRPVLEGGAYGDSPAAREIALSRTLKSIGQVCLALKDACFATLRDQGVVLFVSLDEANDTSSPVARSFARRLLRTIAEHADLPVRIGIGRRKEQLALLSQSYREALEALAGTEETIAEYACRGPSAARLTQRLDEICSWIESWRLGEAAAALHSLLLPVREPVGEEPAHLEDWRGFLESALSRVGLSVARLGVDRKSLLRIQSRAAAALEAARTPADLRQAFVAGAEELMHELKCLYSGKKQKLVERAKRAIEEGLRETADPERVRIGAIAARLGVSTGHLSRCFRQVEGVTFERYLMIRRIEFAKQLLLDPFNSVSAVSERCGFSDPTYFSRAFRAMVGMPPSAYAQSPPLPGETARSLARAS